MKRIYLDANAFMPPITQALDKVRENLSFFGNPSSFHADGRKIRILIDEAREYLSWASGMKTKDIYFTSGASESNRLFVESLKLWAKNEGKKINLLLSCFEHPSLLKSLLLLNELDHFNVSIIKTDSDGKLLDLDKFILADVIVACEAHSETGILQNLALIRSNMKKGAILMSDVTQSFARLSSFKPVADIMTASAQKMGGISGAGLIAFSKESINLPPPWQGGAQEGGFRPGTEAILPIVAFGEASKYIEKTRNNHEKIKILRDYLESKLLDNFNIKIIGRNCDRINNTSAVCFLDTDPDALRIAMDLLGLSVGFGYACSGLAPQRSFALKRLGLSLKEEKSTIRFSLHPENSLDEMDEVIARLKTFFTPKHIRSPKITAPISPFYFIFDSLNRETHTNPDDLFFAKALNLAEKVTGSTHPNPSVGAIVVKDNKILALGHTHPVGGMHAERHALINTNEDLKGASLYVTLEPCSHTGRTPPCTDIIIDKGISKVIYGTKDPNPLVFGSKVLEEKGIEVSVINNTLLKAKAKSLITPFKKSIQQKKPFVIAKIATSLDNKIAKEDGSRLKISSKESDYIIHKLRYYIDAILVGGNTVRMDNPRLDVRLFKANEKRNPTRIILSNSLNFDLSSLVFNANEKKTIVITKESINDNEKDKLNSLDVHIIKAKTRDDQIILSDAFEKLQQFGITSVLIEPGPKLLTSLIVEKVIDELWWFKSANILGSKALDSNMQNYINEFKKSYIDYFADDKLTILKPI